MQCNKPFKIIKLKSKNKILFNLNTKEQNKASIIEGYYDKEERKLHIIDLGTKTELRGLGYATILLKIMINEAYKLKCKTITLDDASDMFQKQNNIYLKLGFEYINKGQPEMIKYL
jgi:hypothetical protein